MSFWRFIYLTCILQDWFIFINHSLSFDFKFNNKITIILILLLIFIIVICNLNRLYLTIFLIIKFFDLFLKLVLELFVHVKFVKLSIFESLVKLLNEIIESKICPNNQYRQMGDYDISYNFTTNHFMTNRLFHLFNLYKINDSTGYKSNTKFVQES